jgi:hypothetical protein
MRHAIPASISILVIAGLAGRWIDRRLADANASNQKLAAEAVTLGLSPDGNRSSRTGRPDRGELDSEARKLAAAWLELPRARQRIVTPSQEEPDETEKRIASMDVQQRRVFLSEVLAAMGSDSSIAKDRVISSLTEFARQDPRAALELFALHHDLLKRELGVGEVVSAAIDTWSKDDPTGAAAWIKEHSPLLPEARSAKTLSRLFYATTAKDPRQAFHLITTLELDEDASRHAIHTIVTGVTTDEARNTALAALRECKEGKLGGDGARKVADQMTGYLALSFRDQGFQATANWLAGADLNPREMELFFGNFQNSNFGIGDESRWIDWLNRNAPSNVADVEISRLMWQWTERDYEVAGEWLRTAGEGSGKNAAILAYVGAIAPYLPDSATEWAATLPAGSERDLAMKRIYDSLPKTNDEEKQAAEAFAKGQGIE